jgi:hypothetical protein
MLIKTGNVKNGRTLFMALIMVSTKSGGTWDRKVFYKRATNDAEAKAWHQKLTQDAYNGKWNLFNTGDLMSLGEFLHKNFKIASASCAGMDTLELVWADEPEDDFIQSGAEYSPDLLATGGWDPEIVCEADGGSCIVKWNSGTRRNPVDAEIVINYPGKPWVLSVHPEAGTVSYVVYYIWRWPKGWKVIEEDE